MKKFIIRKLLVGAALAGAGYVVRKRYNVEANLRIRKKES